MFSTSPPSSRRRKANKYDQFSKIDKLDVDPFESLMAESLEKNKILEQEKLSSRNRSTAKTKTTFAIDDEMQPARPMSFPDTKSIDPYDPKTFGYIEIATIGGAHGVYGMIKCRCLTDFAKLRLCTPGVRHIKSANKRAPRRVVLLEGRQRQGDEYLIQLEGINDREEAMKLRGSMLYVREEEQIEVEQEEYLVSDLVGLDVFLYEQKEVGERTFVGKVNGLVFADDLSSIPGLHDLLELVLPRGRGGTASLSDELVLIPLVPQLVPVIDLKEGAIYIDPPTGLLDLTYVRDERVRIKAFLPAPRAND
jgi:16S rRNA processing protein RimM